MRNIKFRAYNKHMNKMFYDVQHCFMIGHELQLLGNMLESDEWEVMQYTGMKDSKGREIYEGDYVRCNRNIGGNIDGLIYTIVWDEQTLTHIGTNHFSEITYESAEYMELMGNIYETELIDCMEKNNNEM